MQEEDGWPLVKRLTNLREARRVGEVGCGGYDGAVGVGGRREERAVVGIGESEPCANGFVVWG